jgi:molecular chaperone GrpE (heat shock protein)
MKKNPSPEHEEMNSLAQAKQPYPEAASGADSEDAMAGLQADLDRFRDLALRSQADFENYKKRAAREKEDAVKYANSALLQRLVSILDNFELGLAAAKTEGEQSPVYSGMVLVQKQLNDLLEENGLQAIEAEGKKFRICMKRLPTSRASLPKERSFARPGEGIGLRIACCDPRASLFPAALRRSERACFLCGLV